MLINPVKTKKPIIRDPSKKNFSIAIPKTLVAKVQEIADREHRNRNSQIEHLLTLMVAEYETKHGPIFKGVDNFDTLAAAMPPKKAVRSMKSPSPARENAA